MQLVLTPELILEAYAHGMFPMAYSGDSPYVHWICPEMRGQLSIEELHIPRRLLKTVRSGPYEIRVDRAFPRVIRACAAMKDDRPDTWINPSIIETFCKLHERGHAHSVECWQDDILVGGVYGLKLGSAFFGESMFSDERDASKIALIHMAARLWRGGFQMLDTQFINDHLVQFGVYEIPHAAYMELLTPMLSAEADFTLEGMTQDEVLQGYLKMRREA